MRNILFILTIIPFFTFGQNFSKSVIGTYTYSNGGFYYKLELKKDSTFVYLHSFHRGSTSSAGKWRFNKDTLYLSDYEKPWTIKQVEEFVLDTLGDNSVVDVIIKDTSSITIRGNQDFYIDGQLSKVRYEAKTNRQVVREFDVWINDQCNNRQASDNFGRIYYSNQTIKTISIDHDQYLVKDPRSNYFVLTLSSYPIFVSPQALTWTEWVMTENSLSPIECDKPITYIELTR